MARTAVVGATGQIGREVVGLLLDAGEEVRALTRDTARARERLSAEVEIVEGGMSDAAGLTRLLGGADRLFVVSSDPAAEPAVYEAAGAAAVRVVVKSSAIGFGNEPPSGHAEAEAALSRQPVEWGILRPNSFMQTLRSYLPSLVESDGSFALPAADGASAWVDTRDIAAVAVSMLLDGPPEHDRVVTVTGPESLTMHDVAAVVSDRVGVALRYRPVELEDARRSLTKRLGPMGAFLAGHYANVAAGGFAAVSDSVPRIVGRPARALGTLVAEDPRPWTPQGVGS